LVGLSTEVVVKRASASYESGLKEALADPAEAAAYLNAALKDGSQDVFLMALRDVAKARGLSRLAFETSLNRENMYRILSKAGNPQLSSLKALLDSLGLKLTIEAKRAVA
jgi:probable addiction module antidote protein